MTKPIAFQQQCLVITLLLLCKATWTQALDFGRFESEKTEEEDGGYGVDVSFPIHRMKISTNYPWLPHNVDPANNPTPPEYIDMPLQPLGDRQKVYDEFIEGCHKKYPRQKGACDSTESGRVAMSLRQPASMQNYTDTGFKKIRTPDAVWKLIKDFWDQNKDVRGEEMWPKGNTYTNHWAAPTYMISVENTRLRGGGSILKQAIWDAARDTLQEWTGEELTQCSLYGVRVYTEGAILATHVDRLPLVSSAIVNVAQDVDEPWPLEVIGHDGKAHNVTMEPGDMILYESHSVLHGRPFPLKGRFFANVFIHFEPTGHSLRHHAKQNIPSDVHEEYRQSVKRRQGGHEHEMDGLPSYIVEGSEESKRWNQRHPDNKRSAKTQSFTTGSTLAHRAAHNGDVDELKQIVSEVEDLIHKKDVNGWTPLHEGARAGHEGVVKVLLDNKVNVNELTKSGHSPLFFAEQMHGEKHSVVKLLKSFGGLNIGPEL